MSRISKGKAIRKSAAQKDYPNKPDDHKGDHPDNGEESSYIDSPNHPNYIGNFTKALPHYLTGNKIGQVIPDGYKKLLKAIKSGKPGDFDKIPRGTTDPCGRKFINPQAGLAFDLEGKDSHAFVIDPAPRISESEAASEMAELYWMALCRDVDFNSFSGNPLIIKAVEDLSTVPVNAFHGYTDYTGPTPVNADTIFRGFTPGDLVGPFVSQFLLRGNNDSALKRSETDGYIKYGTLSIDQRQGTVKAKDYLTKFDDPVKSESWLQIQNGVDPRGTLTGGSCNYDPSCGTEAEDPIDCNPMGTTEGTWHRGHFIRNMRDLANYVHIDDLPQEFLNACLILKHMGAACAPEPHGPASQSNPYVPPSPSSQNQEGLGTFGDQHILTLVAEATTRALKAAWFQKWFVHRRLRPEEFGGLINKQLGGVPGPVFNYPVNHEILRIGAPLPDRTVLDRIKDKFGSYLLPQAYPEAAPPHPSYPSGHAVVAGTCVTMMKAYFKEDFIITNPFVPNTDGTILVPYVGPASGSLTVGGELNKLASNIALGRNMAGIHYRSDYKEGLKLGEQVAISILKDQERTYNEPYCFIFHDFDGKKVKIGTKCPP